MVRFKQFINEADIIPSTEPNTMSLWHGGNLEEAYDDSMSHKKGRSEFGPGLYLTTHYQTAKKYAKGSRKFYQITISKGIDIKDATLPEASVKEFINTYVIKNKRNDVIYSVDKYTKDGNVQASIFLNSIVNNEAIKPVNTGTLRQFLVNNHIDYQIVDNAFGWHERMIVLFNMRKIVKKVVVLPKDNIKDFDLPTNFNESLEEAVGKSFRGTYNWHNELIIKDQWTTAKDKDDAHRKFCARIAGKVHKNVPSVIGYYINNTNRYKIVEG